MGLFGDRRGQHKSNLVLSQRVTCPVSRASLRAAIGERLKTKRGLVEMSSLFGVADIKLNVIRAVQRQKIRLHRRNRFSLWSSNCCWHDDLLNLWRRARLSNYKIGSGRSQGGARRQCAAPV